MDHDRFRLSRRELLQASGLALATTLGVPSVLAAPPRETAYQPLLSVEDAARLTGRVLYDGPAVGRPPKVKLTGDCTYCKKYDIRSEALLVSSAGGLQNVAVFLEGIRRGKAPPSTEQVLAELHCTFVPHVSTITAGSKLLLHNQDPVLNTFHAVELSSGRTLFNIGTPNLDQKIYRRVRPSGVIQVRCDVHPWEVAYLVSLPHPYHAVSTAAGDFALDRIPPGRYTLVLWHETLGVQRRRIVLQPRQQLQLKLRFPAGADHKQKG